MNRDWMTRFALVVAAVVSMGGQAQAAPVVAWEMNSVDSFRNNNWSFGEIFTVGGSDILVTGLGAFDANGDGFVSQRGIPVGIFRENDDALLVSSLVTSADTLVGNYRFVDIAPLVLQANTTYRVVANNLLDLYNIGGSASLVDPRITWNGYGYCVTTSLATCDAFTGTSITWMANLQLDGMTSVPEPTVMALFGTGLALGAFRARRRRS